MDRNKVRKLSLLQISVLHVVQRLQNPKEQAIMISRFNSKPSQISPNEANPNEMKATERDTQPTVFFVAGSYSIARRAETSLTVTQQLQKHEATWLPKSVVKLTEDSGFSIATIYGALLLFSLFWYGAFIVIVVNIWERFASYSLSGVMSLAMIYGAQAVIGILISVIKENNAVKLVSRFLQSVGSIILLAPAFLLGGWGTTQWLRTELIPRVGDPLATTLSVIALGFVTQFLLSLVVRFYRATQIRQS